MSEEIHIHIHAPKGAPLHIHVHGDEAAQEIPIIEPKPVFPTIPVYPSVVPDWLRPPYTITVSTTDSTNTSYPNGTYVWYGQSEMRFNSSTQ